MPMVSTLRSSLVRVERERERERETSPHMFLHMSACKRILGERQISMGESLYTRKVTPVGVR
jgi:hypothetical protein